MITKSLLLTLALTASAHADTYTWSGTDGNFSDPAAWSGSAPVIGGSPTDQLVFPTDNAPSPVTATIDAAWILNSLSVGQSPSIFSDKFSMLLNSTNNSPLLFQGDHPTIYANTPVTSVINAPISSTSDLTITGNTLTIAGPLSFTTPSNLIVNADLTYANNNAPANLNQLIIAGPPQQYASLTWNFHQSTAAPAIISFGSGPITLNSGWLNLTALADTGSPNQLITLHNDVVVQGSDYNAIFLTPNGPVAPHLSFDGNITLAGQVWIGNGSWQTSQSNPSPPTPSPLLYSGTVTLDQSSPGLREIYAFPAGDEAFNDPFSATLTPAVELSANIIDDPNPTHTAQNPLTLGCYSNFLISGTQNTYSTGTIIAGGYPAVTVAPTSSLGTGNVDIQEGTLLITALSNIAPGKNITIESDGILALNFDQDVSTLINPTSAGTLALNTFYTHPINLATLGNGLMSLGSTTTGTYAGNSLTVGTDHIYHLHSDYGTLTILNSVLTDSGSISNSAQLQNIILLSANSYSGGTLITGNCTAAATSALGSGNVTIYGPDFSADGPINYVNRDFGILNLSAPNAYHANVTVYGTLAFTGSNGALTTTDPFPTLKPNATLQLGDGLSLNNDRFPDSLPLNLDTNTLLLNGFATTTETIGPVSFRGVSTISLQASAGLTDSTTLLTPFLTRQDQGILIIASTTLTLGSADPHSIHMFLNSPPLQTNNMLPPYIQIQSQPSTSDFNPPHFATYGPLGLAPAPTVPMPASPGTGTENVDINLPPLYYEQNATVYLNNSVNIYALRTNTNIEPQITYEPAPTLQINSGGIIAYADGFIDIGLNVDFANAEAIINSICYSPGNTFSLSGIVTAAHGLTLFGGGGLTIYDAQSTLAGPITIHQGILSTAVLSDANSSLPINIYSGGGFNALTSMTIARPIQAHQGVISNFNPNTSNSIGLSAAPDTVLTLNNNITGNTSLTIGSNNNNGTVRINGNVTLTSFPGTTGINIEQGTLFYLNGSVSVTGSAVNQGALAGTGSLHTTESINNVSLISPGNDDLLGTLTLTLDSGELHFINPGDFAFVYLPYFSGLAISLDPSGISDQLLVNAPVEIDSGETLNLNFLAPPTDQIYTLISYASITGTFSTVTGLPANYSLDYTPTSLLLIPNSLTSSAATPEPAALSLLALSTLPLLLRRRQINRN